MPQIESESHEIARRQRALKEELASIFKEKVFHELALQKEVLEKNLEEKIFEIDGLNNDLSRQKTLFEDKIRVLLIKLTDQDIKIHNLLTVTSEKEKGKKTRFTNIFANLKENNLAQIMIRWWRNLKKSSKKRKILLALWTKGLLN